MASDLRPPATATQHPLPFERLSPADFERLTLWLVKQEGYTRVEAPGEAGSDEGQDIVAWKEGNRVCFQCKRVRQFGPTSALAEIEKLRKQSDEAQPDELIFVVTCAVSAKTRRKARTAWGDAETCNFWAGSELDQKVKLYPELMAEFFRLTERPRPAYEDSRTHKLASDLDAAYQQRAELEADGHDISDVNKKIRALRRRIRESGRLKAGDYLLDGRFNLLEQIGQGGLAEVWKAYDRNCREVRAIKILHRQYVNDQTCLERFFRGARQMARLKHPNIVRVLEQECRDDAYHFFVMDYISGGDLRRAVLEGDIERDQWLGVTLDIGKALSHAHKRGVIHRDVKPANILLTAENHPMLTDFDLVRAEDTTGGTRTGALGTFLYAAPESMTDAKSVTAQADVFSLGMTSLFILNGEDLPFEAFSQPVKFISSLDVEAGYRYVLRRAVAQKREERWSSIARLCQALELKGFRPLENDSFRTGHRPDAPCPSCGQKSLLCTHWDDGDISSINDNYRHECTNEFCLYIKEELSIHGGSHVGFYIDSAVCPMCGYEHVVR